MNFFENITFRRARSNSDNNKTNVSGVSSEILDGTTSSLPDISSDEIDITQQLQNQIKTLEIDLKSAHTEIETLSLENNNLKRKNDELMKKNELYKKVTQSPIAKQKSPTPKKKPAILTNTQHTQTVQDKTPIRTVHTQTETGLIVNKRTTTTEANNTQESKLQKQPLLERVEPTNANHKNIRVLSTNRKHKVLSAAADGVPINKKYEICHFLTPNVNIGQLIKGLDTKLSGFTKNDYCIILIGEEDFRNPNDYYKISSQLRYILQKVKHTNIVICLPTYKYYMATDAYNWRVDNFRKLLHLEVQALNHVFLFDPNKNGTYDSSMIHRHSGTINNSGMRAIFKGLHNLIEEIEQKYSNHKVQLNNLTESESNTEMQFFRE